MKRLLILAAWLVSLGLVQPAFAKPSLYEDLGGQNGLVQIVDKMMAYSLDDQRIAATFENSNIDRLKPILVEHFCELADGPCTYDGQDMRRVHTGLGIETRHFNALVENLQRAMRDMNISYRTQGQFLARLAPMHRDIVDIPYEDAP